MSMRVGGGLLPDEQRCDPSESIHRNTLCRTECTGRDIGQCVAKDAFYIQS